MKTQSVLSLFFYLAFSTLAFGQLVSPNNRLLFFTDLNGGQEVPPVNTNARGIATVLVSEDLSSVSVHAVFSGLSGPITGCHFHNKAAGENGPVMVNFTADITGNRLRADLPVPANFFKEALNKRIYLNVHTAANPGGEIRGQLELAVENNYAAYLTGINEVPSVTTNASGLGSLSHSPGDFFIRYLFEYTGLSGPITGAHIHSGALGTTGPIVAALNSGLTNTLTGTLELTALPVDFLQKLETGQLYVNIHTAANPNGEIRGQLFPNGPIPFEAVLNGDQETPPVTTAAHGIALGALNATLDSVAYRVVYNGVTPTAAHFHTGPGGVAGPVAAPLSPGTLPNTYVAKIPVNAAAVGALLRSGLYVNIHSAAHPNGEIRGQIQPLLRRVYAFDLCAEQETPPNASPAVGAAWLTTNYLNTHLNYRYIVDGLTGPATAAHIHEAAPGSSGPVYIPLNLPVPVGSGQFQITGNDVVKLESGNLYFNVHTTANSGGEVRGQIRRGYSCSFNTDASEPVLSEINIFPNPAGGALNLRFNALKAFEGRIRLVNPAGGICRVENRNFTEGEQDVALPVESLPAGLYFVQIYSEKGLLIATSRFVKG